MKNQIALLPVVILFFSAGSVRSQAPAANGVLAQLQGMISTNKTIIDTQQKTIDGLDQVSQNAEQLKAFGKRG